MKFIEAINSFFSKWKTLSGRASRSEYWYVVLFMSLFFFMFQVLDDGIGSFNKASHTSPLYLTFDKDGRAYDKIIGRVSEFDKRKHVSIFPVLKNPFLRFLSALLQLLFLLPAIAVSVRRLHDIGKSGWWQLVAAIPLLGWCIMIYWGCQEGDKEENRFGKALFNTKFEEDEE